MGQMMPNSARRNSYSTKIEGYNLQEDCICDVKNDGRRNLTVYIKDRLNGGLDYKITKYNSFPSNAETYHSSVNELIKIFSDCRIKKYNEESQKKLEKFNKVKEKLGDCIALEVSDRKLLIAHVPNKNAIDIVKNVLKEHNSSIISDIVGDMNFRLSGECHFKVKELTNHQMSANTDVCKMNNPAASYGVSD